jgi:signal peptidase I
MDKEEIKKFLKKVWHFIWEDNSIWSWIVNIILAFLIIKFLVYPGLGLMFGTTHPVVAVVSGSMEHDGSFSNWWNSECGALSQGELYDIFGVTQEEFLQYSFKNGFNKGDIMIVFGDRAPQIGDVIVFNANTPVDPIIHRIINMTEEGPDVYYTTKGDYNCGLNEFEVSVPQDAIIGKAVLRVPLLGWIKVAFVGLLDLVGIV